MRIRRKWEYRNKYIILGHAYTTPATVFSHKLHIYVLSTDVITITLSSDDPKLIFIMLVSKDGPKNIK